MRFFCLVFSLFLVLSNIQIGSGDVVKLREGVQFSYVWGNGFLDFIRPERESINFLPNEETQPGINMSVENLKEMIVPLLRFYWGYIILFVLGIMFIVFMPIVGFCFCCCRCCCGRCGANPKEMDSRHAKCKRIFFALILLVLTTIMLLCIVLAGINNQLIHETVSNQNSNINLFIQVNNSLEKIQDSIKEMNDTMRLNGKVNDEEIITIIEGGINDLAKKLNKTKEVWKVLILIQNLKKTLEMAKNLSSQIETIKNIYSETSDAFKEVIDTCRDSLTCKQEFPANPLGGGMGHSLQSKIEAYNRRGDEYKNLLDSIENQFVLVRKQILDDISSFKQESVKSFSQEDLFDIFITQTRKIFNDITMAITNIRYNYLTDNYKISLFPDSKQTIISTTIEIDSYRTYFFVGLACVLLLIVIFYYIGLCFGICGERPHDDAGVCNSGVGSNILLAGVGFTFLFSWLIMIIITWAFFSSAPWQTEICRYLTSGDRNDLEVVDKSVSRIFQKSSGNTRDLVKALSRSSISGLLDKCVNTKSDIVDAMELGLIYTSVVNNNPTIQNFQIEYKKYLSKYKNIVFEPNIQQLNTWHSLIADPLLPDELYKLHNFHFNEVAISRIDRNKLEEFKNKFKLLSVNIVNFMKGMEAANITKLQSKNLLEAINDFKDNSVRIIEPLIDDTSRTVSGDIINLFLKVILFDQKCDKLGTASKELVKTFCVNTLHPFLGYVYGMGLCLWLLIPALIFAVKLANLYRKKEKYSSDYEEPDYMSYQGFYISQNDNIPLDRKSSRNNNVYAGRRDGPATNANYHQLPVYSYDSYE